MTSRDLIILTKLNIFIRSKTKIALDSVFCILVGLVMYLEVYVCIVCVIIYMSDESPIAY